MATDAAERVAELEVAVAELEAKVLAHPAALRAMRREGMRRALLIVEELLNQAQAESRASHSALRDGAVQALGRARDQLRRAELEVAIGPPPDETEAAASAG